MNKLFLFIFGLIGVYALVFLLIPDRLLLALDPTKFFTGEFWRLFTYQFTHLNFRHLIENVASFGLAGFIAFELKTKFKMFSFIHLLTGLLAIIPIWLILRFTALGASSAIYGLFGLLALEAEKFKIKWWYIFAGVIVLMIIQAFMSLGSEILIEQGLSHFSGLVFGVLLYFGFKKGEHLLTKRKRYILRRL